MVFSLKRIVIYLYQEDITWALMEGILALGGSKGGTWQVQKAAIEFFVYCRGYRVNRFYHSFSLKERIKKIKKVTSTQASRDNLTGKALKTLDKPKPEGELYRVNGCLCPCCRITRLKGLFL